MNSKHGMSQERWNYLMQPFDDNWDVMLTAEELNNGWHWCEEWDCYKNYINYKENTND